MTEIDDITQQLTQSAGRAVRAARQARHHYQQRTTRQREEARREREHRLRLFEARLRTTILQRQSAAREDNHELASELASIERDQRTNELIARWAAAVAHRDADPEQAEAWTTRLRENGIDPDTALAMASDEFAMGPLGKEEIVGTERLAADYTDMATDLTHQQANTVPPRTIATADTESGAETARLIGLAHPGGHGVGPTDATAIQMTAPSRVVDAERAAGL